MIIYLLIPVSSFACSTVCNNFVLDELKLMKFAI
jgi:hypothetical protein